MATLYDQQGATKSARKPVFFATMMFNRDSQPIFDMVLDAYNHSLVLDQFQI